MSTEPPSDPATLHFGGFVLSPAARELRRGAERMPLGQRAFGVLLALAERGGEVVDRDALFARAWPGRVVVDDNLKVQVMALRRVLGADAIATVPGRGYRLAWPVQRAAQGDGTAGPVDGSLLGRGQDLDELLQALAPARLLTVVGSGGIGKTRLALAAAAAARARFADGAVVVELAALADPTRLPATVARACALAREAADAAALGAALAPLSLLLVLDNCEHLREAAAALAATLLEAAPGIALLATSQEPLAVPGERLLRLDGLACPAGDAVEAVAASPAAALLAERVRAADADFTIDAGNAAAVAAVCRRLEGLPLALELAAARVRLLGIAGVQARLDRQLELLSRGAPPPPGAPPRQQTLRGALQWSHGLLDAPARTVFRRLAVFAGSFAPAAAQQVCADDALDEWAVLDQLRLLADRSLLQRVPAADATGEARWRLLVAAQQFAAERLDEAGETTATRRRHAEAMLAVFDAADEAAADAPVLPWVDALLPDLDNLRAALEWALGAEGDLALAVALAGAAGSFWHAAGLDDDAGRVLRRLQPLVEGTAGQELPPRRRALFWWALALRGADARFSWQETFDAADRALAIARESGDARLLHRVMGMWLPLTQRLHRPIDHDAVLAELRGCEGADWSSGQRRARRLVEGRLAHLRGDLAGFIDGQRAELALARAEGDDRRAWLTAHNVAIAELGRGRVAEAVALMRPVADEIRARGLARRCWQQMAALALALIEAGEAAAPEIPEAVALMQVAGALTWMPCHLAEWMAQRGRLDDAARLLGWTDRRYAERGESASAQGEAARRRLQAVLDGALAPAQQQALHDEGARLSDEAAARLLRGAAAA
ncbi:MAG: helix-turn-helix transcriptional regulator [Rubrivivax sp.]|nr:helix-turn-helix transcriptional regulator [Rubrivivax sp.]